MARTARNTMLHDWNVTPGEARTIQESLRDRVRLGPLRGQVRRVAGADLSLRDGQAICALPVLDYPSLEIVEVGRAVLPLSFPYVPGLLSFRECPAIVEAFRSLQNTPDLLLLDGQGIAHPRRFGLASHVGVLLDVPTIGCAKTRFIGYADEPDDPAGCYTDLIDDDELIGALVRTRERVKPMYISPGHLIDIPTSIDWALNCCDGYRLPEPTRLAHQWAGKFARELDL